MFCGFCQMYYSMHPQSTSKVWKETPNMRHGLKTFQGHLSRPKIQGFNALNSITKERLKAQIFCYQRRQKREKSLNALYDKVFETIYSRCKKKAESTATVLIEILDVLAIAAFQTHSPAPIRNMVLMLAPVIKEKLADKVTESHGLASLTYEVTCTKSSSVCLIL